MGGCTKPSPFAVRTLQSTVEPLERSGRRLPAAGNLYIILGRILFELYELKEAEANLTKGVELSELTTPIPSGDLLDGYHALACLRCIKHDFEGALAWMDKAERTCTWVQEGVHALQVRIWLWQARIEKDKQALDQALSWARARTLRNPARNEWELQSLAQAYIAGYRADGEPDLAPLLGILDEQVQQAEAAGRDDLIIYMLILEALARQAMGQMDQAINLLERALALASTHGFVMSFVSHGSPMEALLREAVRARDFQRVYDPTAGGFQHRQARATPCRSASSRTRPLTSCSAGTIKQRRELEVLRLLASSLSGPQIADELFISLGTFQAHTKSIYGKLGVHNRIEAIQRARDLKLI